MRIEYHRTLIADRVRNEAFERALAAVIRKGETTVADIGAGTGLLGLIASRLGAREVHLYETAAVAGVAAAILKANRTRNGHLYPCHSTEMRDPPRVDVVVSETLGNYAFEENIVDTLNDAVRRHLKPGGIVIPRRLTQVVAPVVTDRIHRELTAWDTVGLGLDFAPARTMSLNNIYVRMLAADELLHRGRDARAWDAIDFTKTNKSSRKGEAQWTLDAPTTIYGFATWWVAELVPGVELSTAPGAPATHWEQLYFPLLHPMEAKATHVVSVSLKSRSSEESGTHLAWTALRRDRHGQPIERQALDLDKGYLP
jgi:protein arginine N-methyltransferase 1